MCACSDAGTALYAHSRGAGAAVIALSEGGTALNALSLGPAAGLYATSAAGHGVDAVAGGALGGGTCPRAAGVFADGGEGDGLYAVATAGDGVVGVSHSGHGVDAFSAVGVAVRARGGRADGVALLVEGRLQVRGAAAGEVVLEAGRRALAVTTPAATAHSQIILTPLGDPGAGIRLWVSARAAGRFTIRASRPLRRRLAVQYLIVN